MEQRVPGTLQVWAEPFTNLRVPRLYNLRLDPYERADITSNTYFQWLFERIYLLVPAQAYVGKFLETFKEYPPRQKADTFNLDAVMKKKLMEGGARSKLLCIQARGGSFTSGLFFSHGYAADFIGTFPGRHQCATSHTTAETNSFPSPPLLWSHSHDLGKQGYRQAR